MASFELNFNSPEKTVTISLENQNGIFQLAELFKKLLDEAGIENTLTEKYAEPVQSVEATEEQA
jgi:metal-dependent HD superfamily phosphatase/phosphodiesterase